jgi:hypothetical protein
LSQRMKHLSEGYLRTSKKLDLIKRDYASFKAGYQGEKRIDYYFSLMDQTKYDFYHGIRLSNGKDCFQIDTLMVFNYFILADELNYPPLINLTI